MTKKVMMIALYMIIGFQAKASHIQPQATSQPELTREVAKTQNICSIHAGDIGKLKFKGSSYEEAFTRVTDECFNKRTQLFVQSRNQQPDQDRQILFAESCVNSVECI